MAEAADTPSMREYLALKAQVPDALLLYQMGDFYELFFEDAVEGARLLELTLTSRNKNDPEPIPMAGLPVRAADAYLRRLTDLGRRFAIADQYEQERGVFVRRLTRVVSPGLPLDASHVEAREHCWLASVASLRATFGLAFLDATTGDLFLSEPADAAALAAEIFRRSPREIILPASLSNEPALLAAFRDRSMVPLETSWFEPKAARRRLEEQLGVHKLDAFGAENLSVALSAAGALLRYAHERARVDLRHLRQLRVESPGTHLLIDEASRRNLELLTPLRGTGRKGTLLGLLDHTLTAMGARLLRTWLLEPLLDPVAISTRHFAVEGLLVDRRYRPLRDALRPVADIARLSGRIAQETASAKDLLALANSLRALPAIAQLAAQIAGLRQEVPPDLAQDLLQELDHWLAPDPPPALTEGGLIREGASPELDRLRSIAQEGIGGIARIEAQERALTGINSLKIKHNKIMGYFLEVTQANREKVPDRWIRKQTLSNAERYLTPELKEFEDQVSGAEERSKALEYELFRDLRKRLGLSIERLQALAAALARLDVLSTFALLAEERRWVRPSMDMEANLDIRSARHPVVEAADPESAFVPNDLTLGGERRLLILTGPNMAGKSTVMRQLALIVLMAQAGSFVPAESARLGIVDRIFVRVGASDDLAGGRSTFMVEMAETAYILNHAGPRSLILLDEIGRGTSTYDGLSIAWAVAEAIHDRIGARSIFATHYHELISLADSRPGVVNMQMTVAETAQGIQFLRVLREGGASKSYGIQCARLAGISREVVERAQVLLAELERRPRHGPPTRQLSLFQPPPAPPDPAFVALRDRLATTDIDALTPRAAMELLYRLQEQARATLTV